MKRKTLFFLCLLMVFSAAWATAQEKDQLFWDKFDQARLYIAKHNAGKATRILEELNTLYPKDPNVGYLLGVSFIIQGKEAERAAALFEQADKSYPKLWDNPGVGPPEHLSYYMILAYCRSGNCDLAKKSLARLESVFISDKAFLQEDEYYLLDGRKWANMCREPTMNLLEVSERLVKPDLRIKTRPHLFSTYSTLYGVQVAALLDPQMTRKFAGLKNVEMFVDLHGVYRYVIGNFIFKSQAEKMLEVVNRAGYSDAFIVKITDQERFPFEVVALDQKSPKAQIRGSVEYKVQLAAFRETMPDNSARFYLMVDSIGEMSHDDLTLLTVGNFKSYGRAIERRDELKRMGFGDAFIVAFNEKKKIPIDDAQQYLIRVHE